MKKLNKKIIRIILSVILTISLIMGFIPLPLFSETVYAAKYEITVRANNYAGKYDGTEKSASGFVTLEFTVDGNKYTVSGLTTSDPKSTDVCNLTNKISGTPVVKDSNSNDVTDWFDVKLEDGWLEIRPRNVTLTSDSDAKIYDGTPLTNDYVTVGGDGFAPGEGATYEVTGSQTIVGSSYNYFTYMLNDNTNIDNYDVSSIPGTLKVVSRTDKYKISPQANSKTVNYDGFSWEVTGFETDTYEVDGNTYTVSGLEAYANEKEVGEHPVNVTGTAVVKDSKGNDVTSEFEVTPKPGKLIIKNSMIQYTVTFKVENGEWNDGGSDDKTVTLSRKENEDLLLRLKAEDIPGVGNKPSSGFKAGEWDITPSTEMVISRDRVFTYTYDQKAPVSHTVTFKVENGTWNDGTTEDKKIIVSGYEGDTLKLSADQIPLVGTKPDSEHKKGKWDVTPNIATEITEDTTYTYTYADKKMIKYTVTFKVENGEWDDGGSEDKVVTLSREEAEDLLLLLKNEDIPAVGNKPSNGFKAGGWDTAPRTDLVISEDKTYTYTYAQKASISQNVTFKVENGTWNDGTTDDIKVILTGYEGDTLKLAEGDIPEVGDKPEDTYKAGGWDTVPVTDTEITTDTTYTYSYAKKDTVTHKATFKVVNGTWSDGTSEDKIVTLSGYEGDILKLSADQIPLVGTKPDSEHKKGKWDVTPNIATEITGDTTYTYTYADKKMIKYTVTFKVENGTWSDGTTDDIKVTLTGYEGDTLKLPSDKIPTVGDKPATNYKEGSWDVVPSTDAEISKATTYTYKYAKKNIVSHTVTFKVVDGSWNDGTALDKVVTLNGYEGDTLTLAEEDIPSAGEKPADTYKAGGWDTVPTADTELTTDVTYTYSYAKKDTVTYTATFKVENGTWNDGTTDDITLTISGFEGDALKFTSDDIPSAGEKPAETYKAGQWDTAFSAENVLTGDTTYTYTYKEKDKISKTVIFKVKNGTWNDGTSENRIVILNGYEGDILKLSADQIPSAGDNPGDGYTEGKWDAVPVTDKEVTADAVYTYTYDEKIEVVKPEYYFVKGADGTVTEGAETEQEIIVKRTIDDEHCKDHHRDVEFGGVILEKDKDYLVGYGSTIVTIKGSFIKKLKPGVYNIKVIFDDGVVTTTLTVKKKTTESTTETTTEAATEAAKKPAEKKKDTNAATGDDMNLWIALMLLSMSGMAVLAFGKKKRNK